MDYDVANPQAEDGHIDIANEIAEALMITNLTAYQSRVLWAVWRKTYGWHKKNDLISVSQISKMTQLSHGHVSRALKELELRNIIIRTPSGTKHGSSIGFQKNFEKWKSVPYGVYRTPPGFVRTQRGTKPVPHGESTKENKETIQKKIYIGVAEKIYENHPRKGAKQDAMRNICILLKQGISKKELTQAQENYIEYLKRKSTEPEYIIQANNFFGRKARWKDFLQCELSDEERAIRDFKQFQVDLRREKESNN